jgi:putative acetyltransferase
MMRIAPGGLEHPAVVALLHRHFDAMLAASPPGTCHFLDLSALAADDVTFLTAWEGDTLLGCGAMKRLSPDQAEVKSMRTTDAALRRGVAGALLTRIIEIAREQGLSRLSLETGTGPAFEAAEALYLRYGFVPCGPFGDYEATDFNRYMTREL